MKITIVGAGNIGGTIGARLQATGHDVTFGLRDPSKKPGGQPVAAAISRAEVVLLAMPGSAVADFARDQGKLLDGRVVIDATNHFRGASNDSWQELSEAAPKAQLYRAFNTLGWEVLANPVVGGVQADLFFCGPDGPARSTVERLIQDVGLRPVWVGGTDQVGTVDGLLKLWFNLSHSRGRRIAFKLIADPPKDS